MHNSIYSNTRCVDGTIYRHSPGPDDPHCEIAIGRCEECEGKGCERLHREDAEKAVGGRIAVSFVHPPIPDRQFDYCATLDGDEPDDNGNMRQGYGRTEMDAIDDLVALIKNDEA